MSEIKGNEFPLLKIFSSDFEYHIPPYQRPYAWTEEEAGTLFDDLYDFYKTEGKEENYFLGSIVLVKENLSRIAEVIDGQQRLTTLTILFSAIAATLKDQKAKSNCMKYLQEEGDILAGIASKPRVFLRNQDQAFFNRYVQNVNISELMALDIETVETESQKHIKRNCEIMIERLKDDFQDNDAELIAFCSFLLNHCYLVAVSTPNKDSAYRIFSVMNSRGLDLSPTDIIKSETIGQLSGEDLNQYTGKWEHLENEAGRDGFNEIFTHMRTIFAMEKAKKNLLEEIRAYIYPKTTPNGLVDDYLIPYTEAYLKLKNNAYVSTRDAEEINNILYWLNKIGNYDWMPSAIIFITQHVNDSEYVYWFVKKLERLAAYLQTTGQDVNHRMARYKHVLAEIKERPNSSINDPLKNIELTEWEKLQFLSVLNGDIYTMPSERRNYIIQRLDSFVSDGGAQYNVKLFTIEHVLPQTPSESSEWMKIWPDQNIRLLWLNKIANLVPLTRQRNSAAQNYDFDTKKIKYFQTKEGTSSYQLTTQVINIKEWTPLVVEERQKYLLDVFTNKWDLRATDEENNVIYIISGRGGSAKGNLIDDEKFIVYKDSRISEEVTKAFVSGYAELRSTLIEKGIINNGIFTENYIFESSSAAAAVILGRSSNGRKEWTTLDGRALGKYVE